MKFIKLTYHTEKSSPIWINIEKIIGMELNDDYVESDEDKYTDIETETIRYSVNESPEKILEMINEINSEERCQNFRDSKYTRMIPFLYSNKGMEELVGKPVIERRDFDGKIYYELDKKI
jgi:hypothetical protein